MSKREKEIIDHIHKRNDDRFVQNMSDLDNGLLYRLTS